MKTHKGSAKRFRRTPVLARLCVLRLLEPHSAQEVQAYRGFRKAVLSAGDAAVVSQRMGAKN